LSSLQAQYFGLRQAVLNVGRHCSRVG